MAALVNNAEYIDGRQACWAYPVGSGSHIIRIPWAHPKSYPTGLEHLDRLSRFCRVDGRVRLRGHSNNITDTSHAHTTLLSLRVAIVRILMLNTTEVLFLRVGDGVLW